MVQTAPLPATTPSPDQGRDRPGGGGFLWMPSRRGFTLLELSVVLTLISVLVGLGTPLWRSMVDRWAVRTVRDRTAVALHRSRVEARLWGGARLEVDAAAGHLRIIRTRTDSLIWEDDAAAHHRVRMVLPRGVEGTTLAFDALGLGVVASRTILFRRGEAEDALIVSSRGRGRRQ